MAKVNSQLCYSAGCVDYIIQCIFVCRLRRRTGSTTYIKSVNQTMTSISLGVEVHDLPEWQASGGTVKGTTAKMERTPLKALCVVSYL